MRSGESTLTDGREKELHRARRCWDLKCPPQPGANDLPCNPGYLGGRDQEDHSSKPAWANSSQDPISKTPITKKGAGGVAQGPEFKP
jgi:hypothetical protein